jgi:N-acetylglucosamine-6-phosphate deacetylase
MHGGDRHYRVDAGLFVNIASLYDSYIRELEERQTLLSIGIPCARKDEGQGAVRAGAETTTHTREGCVHRIHNQVSRVACKSRKNTDSSAPRHRPTV